MPNHRCPNSLNRFACLVTLLVIGWLSIPVSVFAQQERNRLKYGWEIGQSYGYEFEAEFGAGNDRETATGFVTYILKKTNVDEDLSGGSLDAVEEGESTSTAFAVTADGYLLTCAHCVECAKTMDVVIGDKKLRATVVEADYDLDLALIKVDATDLPTVSLGKTKKVELAQDVRAIGFPLSDVLGSSVKVTRGSIAGFVEEQEKTTFQIDVAVNPGNSGGPLVDETGSVVGVVNAKLSGSEISKVGFAIPIQLACEMLDRHKIKYDSESNAKPLSGPDLARKLTPAVFFVESEIGPGGHNHFSNFQFSVNGSMKRPSSTGRVEQVVALSQIIIGANGETIDSKDETNLPMLLGPICQMPFEQLPAGASKSWSQLESLVIPLPASAPKKNRVQPDFGRFGAGPGFGFGIDPFGSRRRTEPARVETRMALAQRKTDYKILKRDDHRVTISCNRELKTLGDHDEYSNLAIDHKSTLVFDLERGIFVSKKLQGDVNLKLGDERLKFPVTFSYRQVDLDTYLNSATAKKDNAESETDTETPAPTSVGLSTAQLNQFIESDPTKMDTRELMLLLNRLGSWNEAEARKQEVVDAIKNVLDSDISGTAKPAIEALLNWENGEATPFVIKEFESANAFSKRSWISKLGRTGHPDAARVLCQQLENARTRVPAKLALVELGAPGEQVVIETLNENADNADVADYCLEILGELGARASSEAIEKLIGQPEWKSKSAAEKSLKQIRRRIN